MGSFFFSSFLFSAREGWRKGGGDQRHPAVFTVSWLRVLMSYLVNYELMGEKEEVEELGCGGAGMGGWVCSGCRR